MVKPMKIPATKEEILENFKKNSNGRPLNKDDYEIAEALSRITYKAYEVGMEDAKQLNMEDMMDNKKCNALHVFKNSSFGQLRTIEEDGKILFCASDVAKALGYAVPRKAVFDHCKCVTKRYAPTNSGVQEMSFIPEGDVYRLITHSKLPGAERFERWVFDEVLPSIRKHGAYMTEDVLEQALASPDFLIELATRLKTEKAKNAQLTVSNQIMQPKAEYFDMLVDRNLLTGIRDTAKELGIRQNDFVRFLLDNGYLFRTKKGKLRPYATYVDSGLFEMKEFVNDKTGYTDTQTMITPKGKETFRLLCI